MGDKTPRSMAMDGGYVIRADGQSNKPISQIKTRPAAPAPINVKATPAQSSVPKGKT